MENNNTNNTPIIDPHNELALPPSKKGIPTSVGIIIIIAAALAAFFGIFMYEVLINSKSSDSLPSNNNNSTVLSQNVTLLDINSATYTIAGIQAQFVDGKFHPERNSAASADQGLNAVIDSYALGDINGDGKTDAVVVIEYGMGANTTRTDSPQVIFKVNRKLEIKNVVIPGNVEGEPAIGFEVTSIDSTGLITMQLLSLAGVDVYKVEKTTRTYRYVNGALVESVSQTAGWKTYDSGQGFEFKYPEKLNTDYTSLAKPRMIITLPGSKSISKDGCYLDGLADNQNITHAILGNNNFCKSIGGDGGAAGHYYTTYYYTVLHSGNYYTLAFDTARVSCGVFGGSTMDTSDPNYSRYQTCVKDQNNSTTIVMKPIQDSVATLKFTK